MGEHDKGQTPEERAEVEAGHGSEDVAEDRFTVLEVFGLKLEVSNPRLADLLTMDAGNALKTDVKELTSAQQVRQVVAEAEEALPDVLLTPATAHDAIDAETRREMREATEAVGRMLGFTTQPNGVWESPTGIALLVRVVEKGQSYAGATHFVAEVADHREASAGEDSSVLFVVPDQQSADVFKVAIRQRRMYHLMRTITLDNLREVASMLQQGAIGHQQALVLLAPVADIDVGEVLSVIRSVAGDE